MAKRKTLPKDFGDLLGTASLEELQAIFAKTLLDARGGYGKQTAIGFVNCPDELIVWLAGQGLDVDAADAYDRSPLWERASLGRDAQIQLLRSLGADVERPDCYGDTPLHAAAGNQRAAAVRTLLAHGADPHRVNQRGMAPLLAGLSRTQNIGISAMADVARALLEAGAPVTEEARAQVTRIGEGFEFHRAGFHRDFLPDTDAGLAALYELFDVAPVPRRTMHDGVSPIAVPEGSWQEQHEALWELLVPSSGPAATLQGEVVRLTGKISREILDNGSPNWGRDFTRMLDALPEAVGRGSALPMPELDEVRSLARGLRSGNDDGERVHRLSELVVAWVSLNPDPIPLGEVPYRR
ncbi:ankyrin repeat domain-containing protein [Leucobacter zeae]|nr:ankyrin repeat domain-containing protein [Leucobacter zeae]